MNPVSSGSGPVWFESPLLAACGVRAAFSTRAGGVSAAPFDSLNLALHVGDDREAVLENRRRLFSALGLDPLSPAGVQQVHSAKVVRVTSAERGRGAASWDGAFEASDGLVTTERGLPIFVLSADCGSLAMAAPDGAGCAAVHAGWRGLVSGIVEEGVGQLCACAGCRPGDVRVFLGAMLGDECYEVQADFVETLARERGRAEADELVKRTKDGNLRFLFRRAMFKRLEAAGVRPGNVEELGLCTACHVDRFYSYRAASGRTGRMAMTVWIG